MEMFLQIASLFCCIFVLSFAVLYFYRLIRGNRSP